MSELCMDKIVVGTVKNVNTRSGYVTIKSDSSTWNEPIGSFNVVPEIGDELTIKTQATLKKAPPEPTSKSGGRVFARISASDLKDKIEAAAKKHDDYEDPDYGDSRGEVLDGARYLLQSLTPAIEKDIGKVCFCSENVYFEEEIDQPLAGYHDMDNGLTFLGVLAGGDWETPVFFIIYWDGEKLRGYVPSDGNPWNRDNKKAYGNDYKSDAIAAMKQYPERWTAAEEVDTHELWPDWPKISSDIQNRITE